MIDIASAVLSAAETGRLQVRSIVLLDWHDGPVEGIAEVSDPLSHWQFRMLGERISEDDLDDRIYLLSHVPRLAMEPILAIAGPSGSTPLVWPFTAHSAQAEIGNMVDAAINSADKPALLIQSRGFRDVNGIWRFVERQFDRDHAATSGS